MCCVSAVRGRQSRGSAAVTSMDSVATMPDRDFAAAAATGDFSLQRTIASVEQRLDTVAISRVGNNSDDDVDDDVMPAVANQMGVGQYCTIILFISYSDFVVNINGNAK